LNTVLKSIICLLIILVFLSSCATSNYYTAQTLKKDEQVLSPGIDNIFMYNPEKKDGISGLSPSFGYIHGLPYRFETGIRIFFPFGLEGMLRHQLNPPSFTVFDISSNLHFGARYYINDRNSRFANSYLKAGLTISKEISNSQLYLGYYRIFEKYVYHVYYDTENPPKQFDSVLSVGIATWRKGKMIFPEINYQFNSSDISNGILQFGFGFRIFINKKK